MNDRIDEIRAAAEARRGKMTVHAMYGIMGRLCGADRGQAFSGIQWRDGIDNPLVKCCDECLRLWNELSEDHRKLLRL